MVSSDRVSDRRFRIAAWALSMVIPCGMVALHDGFGNRAWAQVTPDPNPGTALGTNVIQNGTTYDITGGSPIGINVFHSFGSFSVPPGGSANFTDVAGFTNIFGRVTGGSPSDIQGTIRAVGNANLFLINPSGIIFGPNARLDIGGSFVGTTASAVRFGDGGEFSTTSTVTPGDGLLAVNPSALFFNQTPAGAIVNQSRATAPTDPNIVEGLRVPDGRSLLLVGGDVKIDGGIMQARGGRIELGGLAEPGAVEVRVLRDNILGLRFPEGLARADISLTNQAAITASITSGGGEEAGVVILRGNNVSLDQSNIFSQILEGGQGTPGGILIEAGSLSLSNRSGLASSSFGSGKAGAIVLDVDGSVSLVDNSTIQSNVENGATNSNGGLVGITAGSLSLQSGSQIQTLVRGNENGQPAAQGNAGNIVIDVRDTITIDGVGIVDGEEFASAILSRVGSGATGNAGTIDISTRALSLSNFGRIDTNLSGFGTAGSIFIDATDSVSLTSEAEIETVINPGARESRGTSSPFAGNIIGALLGKGGDVTGTILISTGSLSLTDGAVLNTSTLGDGNAGAIVVVARDDVTLKGGVIGSIVGDEATGNAGAILMSVGSLSIATTSNHPIAGLSTQASGEGNAGLIYVEADDDISLRGFGSVILSTVGEQSTNTDGFGGAIILEGRSLFLRDGAIVSVDNQGAGEAGGIQVTVREDIILRDQGIISAIAASGQGGNILLTSGDFLVLVNDSEVNTEAFNPNNPNANGGNIFVVTKYLIAAPFNTNDIVANAVQGFGGNITVFANRLYDIEKRPEVFPTNDISVSSEFGVDGTVTSNVLNLDPTAGLANLPTNPVDPSTLIAETCAPRGGIADRQKNQFINTGRGGTPPDPNAAFTGEAGVNDLGTPDEGAVNTTDDPSSINPTNPAPVATTSPQNPERVEAQGWVYGENGDIIFTAQAPTLTPTTPVLAPASTCNDLSQLPQ